MPVIEDWLSCFESMFFGSIELEREPLDVNMKAATGFGGSDCHRYEGAGNSAYGLLHILR